jgi:hypothetical protein
MAINGSSLNTQKANCEGEITLTNGHGTYIHANFTVLTAMLLWDVKLPIGQHFIMFRQDYDPSMLGTSLIDYMSVRGLTTPMHLGLY